MSKESLPPIIAEIEIEAPIAHVWEMMTSEATLPKWLGCLNYRRVVGATFHMQQHPERRARGEIEGATHCDVAELSPPHRFAFTWYVPDTPKTLVQIELASEGPRSTRVRLIHQGWEQFPAEMVRPFHEQLKSGWTSGVLPGLKRIAEANSTA